MKDEETGRVEFEVTGLSDIEHIKKTFWDGMHNKNVISVVVCVEEDVSTYSVENKNILVVEIKPASREKRPVYHKENPLTGTYKRNYEGDYRCTEGEVKQMLRDGSDNQQDLLVYQNFDFDDIDMDAFRAYKNRFSARKSDHVFLELDDKEFLRSIGGWRKDRETKAEGLTLAGLLMFGKQQSLNEALPHYNLDYQEKLSASSKVRWDFRITPDGTWHPNLYNFFHQVYHRLVAGLDLPFELDEDSMRKGETDLHHSLREALVNTLIHADHRASKNIAIFKFKNNFIFKNPGRLRIPVLQIYAGGTSDARNPNLLKMFQFIGYSERAGTGFPNILRTWNQQHWKLPLLWENIKLDLTELYLPTVSFMPKETEEKLVGVVGKSYETLEELDHTILSFSDMLGSINNKTIQTYFPQKHAAEIGDKLRYLVRQGWLLKEGHGSGTSYKLAASVTSSNANVTSSNANVVSSNANEVSSGSNEVSSDTENIELKSKLKEIAKPVSLTKKASGSVVKSTILELCQLEYLSIAELSELLNREIKTISIHYVQPMVKEGLLTLRFREQKHHPKQAYKTTE